MVEEEWFDYCNDACENTIVKKRAVVFMGKAFRTTDREMSPEQITLVDGDWRYEHTNRKGSEYPSIKNVTLYHSGIDLIFYKGKMVFRWNYSRSFNYGRAGIRCSGMHPLSNSAKRSRRRPFHKNSVK